MPHAPRWLLGVINLRGVVVPIIDLRLKFNFERAEYNESTVVIILNVGDARRRHRRRRRSPTSSCSRAAQIKPTPSLGNQRRHQSHIIGFGTLDERMRILMDVERLMAGAEWGTCQCNLQ